MRRDAWWPLPTRPNYRGDRIPAAAGVFFVLPAIALSVALAVALPSLRSAALLQAAAIAGFAGLGLVDDLFGTREFGGLRGHLLALVRYRRVTTGLVKLVGGTAMALVLGWWASGAWADALCMGALIAMGANAVNLLDLRPGRALKAWALGFAVMVLAGGTAALVLLTAIALPAAFYAPLDLRARAMMGDTGANALGAALGLGAALYLGPAGRWAAFAVLATLHVIGEVVSFSEVIERNRVLRFLDGLGRGSLSDGA